MRVNGQLVNILGSGTKQTYKNTEKFETFQVFPCTQLDTLHGLQSQMCLIEPALKPGVTQQLRVTPQIDDLYRAEESTDNHSTCCQRNVSPPAQLKEIFLFNQGSLTAVTLQQTKQKPRTIIKTHFKMNIDFKSISSTEQGKKCLHLHSHLHFNHTK